VADITVEVSSPGLTAYGAGAWSSLSFGGDNVTNLSIGSVDAFNSEGWGRLTWGSLVWGEDAENATASVTTPGTPTTWGQSTYGNYSWGQITGAQVETGEELIEAGASVILSTNLLNAVVGSVSAQANFISAVTGVELNSTVNSVFAGENVIVEVTTPGAPTTWGQGSFGQYAWNQITGSSADLGEETITAEENITLILSTNLLTLSITSITITADANLSLNTNLLNTTVGFTSENVNANTIVEVSAPGNLPWGATSWGNGSWGNIGGMEVSQGAEEEGVPSIEVFVSTNLLTLTLTSIAQITADANITANTNLLTVGLGNEDAVPNTIVTLSTNLLNVSVGAASGEVLSTVSPTGVSATASTGRVFIAAWAVVDIGVTNAWSVVDIAA
jgi:hypothetical protein